MGSTKVALTNQLKGTKVMRLKLSLHHAIHYFCPLQTVSQSSQHEASVLIYGGSPYRHLFRSSHQLFWADRGFLVQSPAGRYLGGNGLFLLNQPGC